MPKIYDNIENHLTRGLNETLEVSKNVKYYIGYFYWRHLPSKISISSSITTSNTAWGRSLWQVRRKMGRRNNMSAKNTKWLETLTDLKWAGNAAKNHVADKEGVSVFGDIWLMKINGELVGDTNRNGQKGR